MAQVLNLIDVQRAKAEKGDMAGAAVVELFVDECDVAGLIPWKTLGTVEISDRRTDSIATVGFRQGRGTGFGGVSAPTTDKVFDAVWHMGAAVDADKTDLRDKLAGDIIGDRIKQAVKGMSWTFKDYFLNGDHATDPYGFEGVKVRLANSLSAQTTYGVSSSAELDVRASASPSENTMYTLLDKIDEAIDVLDGHDGDIVLTSSDFISALRSILRRLGKYTMQPEQEDLKFGNVRRRTSADRPSSPVLTFPTEKGLRWYDMGFKADQSTRIVGTDTVNSVACRPAYFIKLGHPYLYGIQQYGIETSDPFKLDDGLTTRVTIDWPLGLHHVHNKAMSVLKGVRVA